MRWALSLGCARFSKKWREQATSEGSPPALPPNYFRPQTRGAGPVGTLRPVLWVSWAWFSGALHSLTRRSQILAPKWCQIWDQNGTGSGLKMVQILGPKWCQIWGQTGCRFGTKMAPDPEPKCTRIWSQIW